MQYYASEAYSCDVTIEFTPTPSRFVYNVFNAQPSLYINLAKNQYVHLGLYDVNSFYQSCFKTTLASTCTALTRETKASRGGLIMEHKGLFTRE